MICKEFGWTITDLAEQPYNKVARFVQIMNIQKNMENKRAEGQNG